MRIVVDAMGGDFGPCEIVKGAVEAAQDMGVEVVLVGQHEVIRRELDKYHINGANIHILDAEEIVGMGEDPVSAVLRKPKSSIVVGLGLLKSREASAFVSAGSTGAVAAAALLMLGKKKGISRSALAVVISSPAGPVFFLDVGANSDCKPRHLLQFAEMGSVYMTRIHGVAEPRVGLLSNGEEATKGNKLARSTYHLLDKSELNFIGNVEGQELPQGKADVIVTDGFTGNVVVKLSEGLGALFVAMSKQAGNGDPSFREAEQRMRNFTAVGGALLLGVEGNVVITHGKSDAAAIKQAIQLAGQIVEQGVTEAIGAYAKDHHLG